MRASFVRLTGHREKSGALARAIKAWRDGVAAPEVSELDPSRFTMVPGSPFAYWVSDEIRDLFETGEPFGSSEREAYIGASTKNNFRFLRTWWEVDGSRVGKRVDDTWSGKPWVPFAKGGPYSPFYTQFDLVVDWENDAAKIEHELLTKFDYLRGDAEWVLHRQNRLWEAGIVWPLRAPAMSPQARPRGVIFSDRGYSAFVPHSERMATISIFVSSAFNYMYRMLLGREGHPEFLVGKVLEVPWPPLHRCVDSLDALGRMAWSDQRSLDRVSQTSHAFDVPELSRVSGESLPERVKAWSQVVRRTEAKIQAMRSQVDEIVSELYSLDAADREAIANEGFASLKPSEKPLVSPGDVVGALLEWTVGVAFGRFDIRLATGERPIPEDPDPFDPLPVCSPGMLQDEEGLPATTSPPGYPIEVAWNGILVDDEGHPRDVVRHIRRILSEVSDGQDWSVEAEEILGRDLRGWVQRSLFEGHIKRYSKSRRKAPIFWRLGTPSGSYSVWLYYPRATGDTLYRVLSDYVEPKLHHEESQLLRLRQESGASPTASQQKRIEAQETLVSEVQDMKGELEVIAQLWRPEFDDGVVLNFAPFWRLVAHTRKWQKECQKHWKKLREGEYDWSYTAMRLWPERVVPACAEDRSFAMAHGLEEEFFPEEADRDGEGASKVRESDRIQKLVNARSSAAVKQALQTLLER